MTDRYDFLTEEQWTRVCNLLGEDVRAELPFMITAPDFPEQGEEPIGCLRVETGGMLWITDDEDGDRRPLSQTILKSAYGDVGEIKRMAAGLQNTIAVLHAELQRRGG